MIRPLALTFAATLLLSTSGSFAQDEFTSSIPLRDSSIKVSVAFHSDHPTMVACTPEQTAAIGARSVENVTKLVPALNARTLARGDKAGSVIDVLLDAACYEGGIMGLGGYGRGTEKITLAYEETTLGGEWGPPKKPAAASAPADPAPADPAPTDPAPATP